MAKANNFFQEFISYINSTLIKIFRSESDFMNDSIKEILSDPKKREIFLKKIEDLKSKDSPSSVVIDNKEITTLVPH